MSCGCSWSWWQQTLVAFLFLSVFYTISDTLNKIYRLLKKKMLNPGDLEP